MRRDAEAIRRIQSWRRDELRVPAPAFAEIAYGLARLPASRRKAELEAGLATIRGLLTPQRWTDAVSAAFGAIKVELQRKRTPLEDMHVAIAAHAIATGASLVTTDVKHMSRIRGLVVEDWTKPAPPAPA
jgi:tRNA(fMet)-specific endonuclease VapC